MDKEAFMKYKASILTKANNKMQEKERQYFSTDDVLANLRDIAKFRKRQTPQSIMDLVSKHIINLSDRVDSDSNSIEITPLEVWDELFVDILNYMFKLYASIREKLS